MDILHKNLDLNKSLCKDTKLDSTVLDVFLSNDLGCNSCLGLNTTKVKVLNWGHNLEEFATYDIILAADVIYLEDTFTDLLQTLEHLSSPRTVILLSCKIRYSRDTRFLKRMRHSFNLTLLEEVRDKDIYLYKARLM